MTKYPTIQTWRYPTKWIAKSSTQAIGLALVACLTACSGMEARPHDPANLGEADQAPPTELITAALVAAEKQHRDQRVTEDLSQLIVANPPPYTIGPGDILSIVVWDHPELAGAAMTGPNTPPDQGPTTAPPTGFVVDYQGHVQFPFAGLLKVSGQTEEQARTLLANKLARYITHPNVTLRVHAYRSKRIYIDGEVKAPGLQAINDIPMTLMEALNRAGGLLPTADQSRLALERGEKRHQLNLRELVQKGINPGAILLLPGDVVRVPSRDESKIFVSGEVVTPRALTMHDGRLTLNEALGESGGVSPLTGDSRQIYVVRKSLDRTHVYQLDARQTGAMAMAEGFELHPKDVVYVAASPLANWHRNLSMLIPGALTSAVGVTTRP
jgi:polysaccharide export outer membrane protein